MSVRIQPGNASQAGFYSVNAVTKLTLITVRNNQASNEMK